MRLFWGPSPVWFLRETKKETHFIGGGLGAPFRHPRTHEETRGLPRKDLGMSEGVLRLRIGGPNLSLIDRNKETTRACVNSNLGPLVDII